MLTGKPNKKWIEQLDRLELPAGSSFDRKAAWTKLQQRLDQKQRRKGFLWWAASAAAAVLVLIYLFTGKQDTQILSPIQASIAVKHLPGLIRIPPGPPASPLVISPARNTNKKDVTPVMETSTNDTTDVYSPPIAAYVPLPDTAAMPVVVKKKKLAVVHNNELTPPELSIPVKKTPLSTTDLLAEYRKHQDLILELTDTLNPTKPRKKLLPFSSIISQKQ